MLRLKIYLTDVYDQTKVARKFSLLTFAMFNGKLSQVKFHQKTAFKKNKQGREEKSNIIKPSLNVQTLCVMRFRIRKIKSEKMLQSL